MGHSPPASKSIILRPACVKTIGTIRRVVHTAVALEGVGTPLMPEIKRLDAVVNLRLAENKTASMATANKVVSCRSSAAACTTVPSLRNTLRTRCPVIETRSHSDRLVSEVDMGRFRDVSVAAGIADQ